PSRVRRQVFSSLGQGCYAMSLFRNSRDNDGYNDTWRIQGIEAYENISINVFTRWGDEVFVYNGSGASYTDVQNQWDGKFKNKDLPTGSYLYVLILGDNDATYKGTISLIK
ncbi:MAG: gliding motility-associated C-terminal domain-containing protein, partial [Bacteroidales bacterium]|nr:gliding motility-associated C-terminal domain-containing protein [Bacteroidales bacterium]